jgi:hypothetical protein
MKTLADDVKDEIVDAEPNEVDRWETRHPPEDILPAVANPMDIMATAVQKGLGKDQLEVLERMFEFDVRVKAQQAKEAFFTSMAEFHKIAPPVAKDKVNTQFKSPAHPKGAPYTSLENYLNTYRPIMASCGLSPSFPAPKQDGDTLTVECKITHELGHSEPFAMSSPIIKGAIGKTSGQPSRNDMQDIKTTFTYLRSATFEAAMGVAGTDATLDADGNLAGSEPAETIDDDQFANLQSLISEVGADEAKFCKYLQVADLDHLPAARYNAAVKALEAKKK